MSKNTDSSLFSDLFGFGSTCVHVAHRGSQLASKILGQLHLHHRFVQENWHRNIRLGGNNQLADRKQRHICNDGKNRIPAGHPELHTAYFASVPVEHNPFRCEDDDEEFSPQHFAQYTENRSHQHTVFHRQTVHVDRDQGIIRFHLEKSVLRRSVPEGVVCGHLVVREAEYPTEVGQGGDSVEPARGYPNRRS